LKNPHLKQKNIWLPKDLIAQVEKLIERTVQSIPGANSKKCAMYTELLHRGLKYTDPATGLEKTPATGSGLATGMMALFDGTGFRNDAELFYAMNMARLMLWATGPDDHNIHVNPWLEYYTGRPALQFRQQGWIKVIHPDDCQKTIEDCLKGFRTHRSFPLFYRMRCYDGLYYPVFDYAQPRFLPDGSFAGYVGSMHFLPRGATIVNLEESEPHDRILSLDPPIDGRLRHS
jgi:hypothetical protein